MELSANGEEDKPAPINITIAVVDPVPESQPSEQKMSENFLAVGDSEPLPPLTPPPTPPHELAASPAVHLIEGIASGDNLPNAQVISCLSRRFSDDEESLESAASVESNDDKEKYLVVEIADTNAGRGVKYIFKAPVEGSVRSWYDELKWRIQAHHHVKYDWVSESESGDEDSSEVK